MNRKSEFADDTPPIVKKPKRRSDNNEEKGDGENGGSDQKKKGFNPLRPWLEERKRKQIERERVLLLREELMMEDLERYLMEIEEKRSWAVLQLNELNYRRIVKRESLAKVERKVREKEEKENEENMKEDGLFYSQGTVKSYKRWQQSPAQHYDFEGHRGAVISCKLSSSLNFMLSCSEDYTMKIWSMISGECLRTFTGHTRVVNDGDFHPNFKMFDSTAISLVSCSGDCTLKLWNSSHTKAVSTIYGHDQAVYRCCFSPDGNSILSCSEDKTVRTWSYPEGYNLFIYRAHTSPVVSISYSGSGRYFISGSDYGERKLLLWDAKLPHFHDPAKFPHVLFWSPEGLITKILIQKGNPKTSFWLAQSQLGLLRNDNAIDIWTGELSDDEPEISEDERKSDNEDEDEDDEEEKLKKKKKQQQRKNQAEFPDDCKTYKGVMIQITSISPSGEKLVATEYNPGGNLIISLKNVERPVQEAFVSATIKETRTDTFSEKAGTKIGDFSLDAPIPWLPTYTALDEKGRPTQRREPPKALCPSKDNHSLIFRKPLYSMGASLVPKEANSDTPTTEANQTVFDAVWNCPEPDLGTIVIVVNFCFIDSKEWHQLRYSLRESPVRIVQGSGNVASADVSAGNEKFSFDQVERHRLFWQFIRNKEWKSAASFIDKKAIAFLFENSVTKRFRVVNLLADIFDAATWAVLYTPFIFKPGVTKSMLMCDTDFMQEEEYESEDDLPEPVKEVPKPTENEEANTGEGNTETNSNKLEENEVKDDDDILSKGSDDPLNPRAAVKSSPRAQLEDQTAETLIHEKITSVEDIPQSMVADIVIPKNRPMTQDLLLPKLIVLRSFLGNDATIVAQIKKMTQDIVSRLINLEDANLDISLEKGCSFVHPMFLVLLKEAIKPSQARNLDSSVSSPRNLSFSNSLLPQDEFVWKNPKKNGWIFQLVLRDYQVYMNQIEKLHAHQQEKLQKKIAARTRKYLSDGGGTVRKGSQGTSLNDLIKTGKFGPEIDEFSMPLPSNFPIRAGLSKHALDNGISLHEKVLEKMKTQSLPKTLEEVYVPTYQERMNAFYAKVTKVEEQQYRSKMKKIMKDIVQIQIFHQHSYLSRRRVSYTALPGLVSHYPNPHYPSPAIIPREDDFHHPDSIHQDYQKILYNTKSYGKDALKAVLVSAVGRKPLPSQMIDIQNAYFQKKFHEAMINNYSYFGTNQKVEYAVNVLDNLVPKDITVQQNRNRFGCFPFFNRKSSSRVNPPPSSVTSQSTLPATAVAAASPNKPSKLALVRSASLDSLDSATSARSIGNMSEKGDKPLSNKKGMSKKSSKKSGKKKKRKTQSDKSAVKIPDGVFLGRRSFFPVLPGLEHFLDTEFNSVPEETHQHDAHEPSVSLTKVSHNQKKPKDMDFAGLIRRFYINNFELAHHGSVNDVAFSPSEARVASAGGDGFIKVWDPRDGTYVYRLAGHTAAVLSLQYTSTEQFLVSAGADAQIMIWSLLTKSVQRTLRGHVDVIYRISISPDCSILVSAANDGLIKSWCTTPRHPDPPKPPKILTVTDTTVLISWKAPPCFNCDVTAFHYQFRVGYRGAWTPENGQSIAPHLRNRVIENLIPATHYQFRIRAENRMGKGDWSQPSVLVRTNFGLPETIQKPIVCQVTTHSMVIGWFTANPQTFGSASTSFQIQSCGDGKSFEDSQLVTVSLEEARSLGEKVLLYFSKMRQRYYDTKDALIKSHGFLLLNRQSEEEKKEFPISLELSIEAILKMLERSEQDETMLFIAVDYHPLHPGYQYLFRVKGLNVAGEGEWSEPTLTINALPTVPFPPSQPRLIQATLRALTFQWDPPHDEGGSAITGYRLYLKNLSKTIELPRSTVTYTWDGLFPGKSYFLRVLAKNIVGESEYSAYNEENESKTMIAPPEKPMNPLAVSATWNTLTYEIYLPYHNGATITKMEIEKRLVRPFFIGEWENYDSVMSNKLNAVLQSENKFFYELKRLQPPPSNLFGNNNNSSTFDIIEKINNNNKEFECLEYVDLAAQQQQLERKVVELELLKSKSAANLLSAGAKQARLNQKIETLLQQQKPYGSRIKFIVNNLAPDTMYEIRASFWNSAGKGEFSHPSHRAKTTKAALPEICEAPHILSYGMNYVVLEIYIPEEGGSPVRQFTIECMDLDTNATSSSTLVRNEYDIQHRQQKLKKKKEEDPANNNNNNKNSVSKEKMKMMSRSSSHLMPNTDYDEDDKLSHQIDGLKLGGSYVFRCKAESDVGEGPYSLWSSEVNLLSEETDLAGGSAGSASGGAGKITGSSSGSAKWK